MGKSRAAIVVCLTVTLLAVSAVPVVARGAVGEANGRIEWDGENGNRPGRTSVFSVRDGTPGNASSKGDRGWYRFSEDNDTYQQSMTMRIECARVQPPWAEFAGVLTEATGNFQKGNVFLVSVLDTDTEQSGGHYIGMKGFVDLENACADALNDTERNRWGILTGGYVDVRIRH